MQFPCFCKKVGWDAKYCCQGHVLAKNSVTETIIITTLVWRIIVLVACYPLSFPALNFRLPRMITLIQVVKFLRVDNKYEVSLEYYMMFICLYFLFLFSWSNIIAQYLLQSEDSLQLFLTYRGLPINRLIGLSRSFLLIGLGFGNLIFFTKYLA